MYKQILNNSISRNSIKYDYINHFFTIIIMFVLYSAFIYLWSRFDWWFPLIYIVSLIVLFIGVTGFITPFIRLKRTSFEIGHRHLEIQSGLYFQKRYVQPYNRIQYVTIKHGPISRRLNIYFLVVVTAGNQRFLPMMGRDMAEEARLKIMTNVKEVLDDV